MMQTIMPDVMPLVHQIAADHVLMYYVDLIAVRLVLQSVKDLIVL